MSSSSDPKTCPSSDMSDDYSEEPFLMTVPSTRQFIATLREMKHPSRGGDHNPSLPWRYHTNTPSERRAASFSPSPMALLPTACKLLTFPMAPCDIDNNSTCPMRHGVNLETEDDGHVTPNTDNILAGLSFETMQSLCQHALHFVMCSGLYNPSQLPVWDNAFGSLPIFMLARELKVFNVGLYQSLPGEVRQSMAAFSSREPAAWENSTFPTSMCCDICLEPFSSSDRKALIMPCGHTFCSGCFSAWFPTSDMCPQQCERKLVRDPPVNFKLHEALEEFEQGMTLRSSALHLRHDGQVSWEVPQENPNVPIQWTGKFTAVFPVPSSLLPGPAVSSSSPAPASPIVSPKRKYDFISPDPEPRRSLRLAAAAAPKKCSTN